MCESKLKTADECVLDYLILLQIKVIEERVAMKILKDLEVRRMVPEGLRSKPVMHVLNLAWQRQQAKLADVNRALVDLETEFLAVEVGADA